MHRLSCGLGLFSVVSACLATASCRPADPQDASPPPLPVTVSRPVERDITDSSDFTGRTDAVYSVDIRARVSGYLTKIYFRDGEEVKKNEPLFLIDPRPYDTTLKRDQEQVAVLEARLIRANADLGRAKELLPEKAISGTDFDKTVADAAEVKASLGSAKAEVERAALDVEFTKILSPIDGKISRTLFTEGNLVNADSTLLTTVVSIDPVYAYFDVDENTFQGVQQAIRDGKIKLGEKGHVRLLLGLGAEKGFPHEGTIDFADNRLDPNTGTLRLRGVFPNPKPASGERVLMPGMFCRVRIPVGEPHPRLMIPEQALGTDQGQKFVYVVNAKNEVEYRRVAPGRLEDSLRVIEEGLQPGDLVIVRGIQRARPGMVVQPKLEQAASGAAPKVEKAH